MKKVLSILILLAVTTTIYSCYKNPVTGRSAVNLVDESTMRQMANQQYASFLASNQVVNGTRDAEMVKRIGSRMQAAVRQYLQSQGQLNLIEGYNWEFNLINQNEANAWAMPGGKVVVYTGIMPIAQNEAGLAVIMGHEIAHVIARHGNERMSQQLLQELGGATLSAALSSQPQTTANIFNSVYGVGSQVGLLHYSRNQESEADKMGLIFMALAGYNPNEAVNFWQRMEQMSGGAGSTPEFLRTHPSNQRRIRDIKDMIPQAMQYYRPQ